KRDGKFEDPEVWRFIREDSGIGLFQISTPSMQQLVKKLPMQCIDDLAQLIAVYRPSCVRAGVVTEYVKAKCGDIDTDYYHPLLESNLKNTAGKMIVQEQVIDVVRVVAGYTRAQGDQVLYVMRKMLGEEKLRVHRDAFFIGAQERFTDLTSNERTKLADKL